MPLTKKQFQDGCSYLTRTGSIVPANLGSGSLFIDGNNQVVIDESDNNADITPDEATLQQALIDLATQESNQQSIDNIEGNSKSQASGIPGWASWDETDALAWHDSNIKDVIDTVPQDVTGLTQLQLVSVIQALVTTVKAVNTENRAMARLIIALRNKNFPDLQE